MKKLWHVLRNSYMWLIAFFLYLPIIYTVVFSFNSSRSLSHFTGFSLQWYEKMLGDGAMTSSIYYTIIIALIATAVSTAVGTVVAIALSKCSKVLRRVVEQINNLPLLNPEIVTAIGLLMFFASLNIKKGFITMLLAHIMFCIPYVILSVMPKIRTLDSNLADAALDLGATPAYALCNVIVPEIMPGIFSGALIAFTMSFDDFIISYFVTGNGVNNISIMVYTMSKRINPSINALSSIIILLISVILVIINVVPILNERRRKRKHEKNLCGTTGGGSDAERLRQFGH